MSVIYSVLTRGPIWIGHASRRVELRVRRIHFWIYRGPSGTVNWESCYRRQLNERLGSEKSVFDGNSGE